MTRETEAIARRYASRNRVSVELPELGGGIHGRVYFARGAGAPGGGAIKVFHQEEFFLRELGVYERLRDAGIREILGLAVPQLIRADGELWVLEMTVVERPYLLDFAGAYLDGSAPHFDEEVWETWEEDKREKFGERWPEVKRVLAALEDNGIQMLDVNPGNVALRE